MISKKTKLELSICHILKTKNWIVDFYLSKNNYIFTNSLVAIVENEDLRMVFQSSSKPIEEIYLTEEELLTYFNQKFSVNGSTEGRWVR